MSRVLLVEDEPVLRRTFQKFLVDDGHEVVAVGSVDDALRDIEATIPDVVITDIILPGKTGVELLERIRAQDLSCPVIMITGEPNVQTASKAVRLGAFDYLAKPVAGRDLVRTVRQALDRYRIAEERDRFARQLEAQRRELAAIFDSVSDGIVALDTEGNIRQINAAACTMLGLPLTVPIGASFAALAPAALAPALAALDVAAHTGMPAAEQHIEAEMADGTSRILLLTATVLARGDGGLEGSLLLLRDVTRLTVLEGQVQAGSTGRHRMVGGSPQMQELFALIDVVADTDSTVLICGESGTGKELVAAALHDESARRKKPFVKVNCAALSDDLLESELFGHVRGAFTGALRDRVGRFEAADGGTILLDEIGDISPRLQLRLLRVLQERQFERVGDNLPINTDVRVIASTNRDLVARMHSGDFREDLYYRLNVVRIDMPPLRARREDIPPLVESICRGLNGRFKKRIAGLTPECMDRLMCYPWYGNVRELENCLERAFVVCTGTSIEVAHLPPEILSEPSIPAAVRHLPAPPAAHVDEVAQLMQVLEATDWNVAKSARLLGRSRNTLYQRMRTLNLQRPQRR